MQHACLDKGTAFIEQLKKWIKVREDMLKSGNLLPSEIRMVREQIAIFTEQRQNLEDFTVEITEQDQVIETLKKSKITISLHDMHMSDWTYLDQF